MPSELNKPLLPAVLLRHIIIFIILIFSLTFLGFSRFLAYEYGRDLFMIEQKLGYEAEGGARRADAWVEERLSGLESMAENESVKLYVSGLTGKHAPDEEERAAYESFLKNYLSATTAKSGISVAITAASGKILAASGTTLNSEILSSFPKEKISSITDSSGQPLITFNIPITGIQDESRLASIIASVPARELAASISPAIPVRKNGNMAEAVSGKSVSLDQHAISLAFAANNPGRFLSGRNAVYAPVFATSREMRSLPWVALAETSSTEALSSTRSRAIWFGAVFLLSLLLVSTSLMAVWKNAASQRTMALAKEFELISKKLKSQRDLLDLVADNQPDAVYILDSQQKYRFANSESGRRTGMRPSEMIGKTVSAVRGAISGLAISKMISEATLSGSPAVTVEPSLEGRREKIIRSTFTPLEKIPVEGDSKSGALVVEQDITEAVKEKETRVKLLNRLIETLITLVDLRDPNAAHHSTRVARISGAVAAEMELDEILVDTAVISGKLMNLGKLMVPSELLTRQDNLSTGELASIRDSIKNAADLLKDVPFDGPVVETLKQSLEHWNGSGPMKLKENEILVTARIIAVVNAFVSLVSDRAYRKGHSFDEAIEIISGEAGEKYDHAAAAALIHYLKNKGGIEGWNKNQS